MVCCSTVPPGADMPHIHTATFTSTRKQAYSYLTVMVPLIVLQMEQRKLVRVKESESVLLNVKHQLGF